MTHLFIVAHVDDAELSCAGLIQKLIYKGDHVKVISLSHVYGGENLSSEFESSMKVLEVDSFQYADAGTRRFNAHENRIADIIYEKIYKYDNVYTHDILDRHPDHRIVGEQVRRMHNGNLFTFICPWNGHEEPNYFVEISPQRLEKKIESLLCYKSQLHRHYMKPDFIRSWGAYNGGRIGKLYAEAFKVERLIQ